MKAVRRHWYSWSLVVAVILIGVMFIPGLQILQIIALLNFAVLILHQFEEYGWPGGGPWVRNVAMGPGDQPERYPLNQNNAFFINVVIAFPFYLAPVFFPELFWLGIAPVLFGFGQVLLHGVAINIRLKSFYNPGMATAILGHLPVGIWYIVEATNQGIATVWQWLSGVIYVVAFALIFLGLIGYRILGPKDSKYPFAPEEMARWDVARRFPSFEH